MQRLFQNVAAQGILCGKTSFSAGTNAGVAIHCAAVTNSLLAGVRAAQADYDVESSESCEGAFRPHVEIPARGKNGLLCFQIDSAQSKLISLISRGDVIGETQAHDRSDKVKRCVDFQ